MPVRKDPSGRRSVQAEVEVPGTPEQVWQAIATGPGITSWFVPTDLEERAGGTTVSHFGPGMDSLAKISTWEPPHRFVADSLDNMGPGAPAIATEWIVEARSGGVCVVRVVHSWHAETDDWNDQFEQHEHGWIAFFRILHLYLTHFQGLSGSVIQVMGIGPDDKSQAWAAFTGALGLAGTDVGHRVKTANEAPNFAGVVERAGQPEFLEELLIRLDEPTPGIAHLFALPMGGKIYLPTRLYLYGEQAPATVAHEEPLWQAWMNEKFPMVFEAGAPA